jgi:hypothetical protein
MSSSACPRRCSSRHYIIDATRLDGWREDDGAAEIKPREALVPGPTWNRDCGSRSPGGPFPNDNGRGPQRRIAIEGRGAILVYLPAYSADFNPIEQFFAKLKAVLRKLAAYTLKGAAYSIESLCKTIAACLDEISRVKCAACLANAGFGQPKRKCSK